MSGIAVLCTLGINPFYGIDATDKGFSHNDKISEQSRQRQIRGISIRDKKGHL